MDARKHGLVAPLILGAAIVSWFVYDLWRAGNVGTLSLVAIALAGAVLPVAVALAAVILSARKSGADDL